jgi:hypothetical protein
MYRGARVAMVPALTFKHLGGLCNICVRTKKCIVRKPAGKISPGRPRNKWKDNIKMDPKITFVCIEFIRVRIWSSGGLLGT